MLRFVLRRALWAIPTLFGVSLVVFLVTTLLPDPAEQALDEAVALVQTDARRFDELEEKRRARFLDLPRFFNARPKDVRARAEEAIAHVVADDALAPIAAHHLQRLGGAAFPYVLPALDKIPPVPRGRVAVALAPIAERMHLVETPAQRETLRDPEQAALFWQRFWEDRALDFTDPALRRSVHRLVLHSTDLRERDLALIDTYVLSEAIPAMQGADRDALVRLTRLAAHAAGRGRTVGRRTTDAEIPRIVTEWRAWWFVHETDYAPLEGANRIAASLTETRYGKWMLGAAEGQLGLSLRDGQPIADKLSSRAPLTLTLTGLAMLLSFAIAVPLGVFTAWRRGRPVDVALAVALFALYSLPTFLAAQILVRAFGVGAGSLASLAAPVLALAAGSLATLSRYQRAAMLDVIGQDYVRAARAKGVSTLRVLVVHALRNAMLPTVTLAGLQFPSLLGGAFVIEEVFGLPGVGYETLRAVEAHDAPWLVVVVLLTALVTTLAIIASDVAYGLLDPRMRESLGARREGAA